MLKPSLFKRVLPAAKRLALQLLIAGLALAVAALVWIPSMHVLFTPNEEPLQAIGVSPLAQSVVSRQLEVWTDPKLREASIQLMRKRNAEWDFMARTFLVLALGNLAERDPNQRERCLEAMDAILEETVRLETEHGHGFFLLPYANFNPWIVSEGRSLFVDGEIALMLGARCLVADRPDYRPRLAARVQTLLRLMQAGPVLSGESYPDECWTFCNSVALAALKISDVLDGTHDHQGFLKDWVATAKERLMDSGTGLLVSSYDLNGVPNDGPEGSTIWLVTHCLQIVDPEFAAQQYEIARRELSVSLCGFGYAREWPASWKGPMDVDSGTIVPGFGASASSSGFALLASASFGDRKTFGELVTSLNMAAFPVQDQGGLRYAASNQVGDAVLAYALTCGPLWDKVLGAK